MKLTGQKLLALSTTLAVAIPVIIGIWIILQNRHYTYSAVEKPAVVLRMDALPKGMYHVYLHVQTQIPYGDPIPGPNLPPGTNGYFLYDKEYKPRFSVHQKVMALLYIKERKGQPVSYVIHMVHP